MSYQAKEVAVRNQQLKVQELCTKKANPGVIVADGADYIVQIGEELDQVLCAQLNLAAGGGVDSYVASLVDSVALTAGGDKKAIRVAALTMATNDVLCVKYIVKE